MNNETTSILLTGVGGQGTILAAKVLSEAANLAGYDIKMSEIHGMSQRGGSVTSHVRWGTSIASPVIDSGRADILVAFQILESPRYIPYRGSSASILKHSQQVRSTYAEIRDPHDLTDPPFDP